MPLARVLGGEVGGIVLGDIHREKGVQLVMEDSVALLRSAGRRTRARPRNGRVLESPCGDSGHRHRRTQSCWRRPALTFGDGVLVDGRCRTSLPDVFAAGDVTNHLHPIFGRLRVEHWSNGYQQGRAAARSLLGGTQPNHAHPLLLVGLV